MVARSSTICRRRSASASAACFSSARPRACLASATRVADSRDLAGQIGGQFAAPGTWLPVAVILFAIGCIPAKPQSVFLPAAGAAFALYRKLKASADKPLPIAEAPAIEPGRIALEAK